MAEDRSGESTPRPADTTTEAEQKKKRNLFGFGKKKSDSGSGKAVETSTETTSTTTPSLPRNTSKMSSTSQPTISHSHADQHHTSTSAVAAPASPTRAFSGSPRIASPAGSQIFERDVQESGVLPPSSPAIPTHIQTENHIPPVLDEASEAITNSKLDPDAVEIVTHNSHQPASLAVTAAASPPGGATPHHESSQHSTTSEWAEELSSFSARRFAAASPPDSASNYGSLDSTDVRRLSFISFADVVQSEQGLGGVAGSRESIHMAGLTSIPSGLNRSPSPIRSPVSSQGGGPGTSPPTSNPGSVKGVEMSPTRKPFVSPPVGGLSPASGELNIETMSQALRRTGSTDLSHVRSIPTSPVDGPGSR